MGYKLSANLHIISDFRAIIGKNFVILHSNLERKTNDEKDIRTVFMDADRAGSADGRSWICSYRQRMDRLYAAY